MPIDIRQLRYAVVSADKRSFSRAADHFNIKQSTLSRRVLQLEDALGVKLFERTTRGAEPTPTGKGFLETARRILTDLDNLQTTARAVSYGEQGRLAVGFSSSLMAGHLKLAFGDYLKRYPDIQFDGVEGGLDKLINGLHAQSLDVVIAPAGTQEAGIMSRPLWSERLLVTLTNDHPLLAHERIYWSDLRREVFVVPASGIGPVIGNLLAARLTDQGYRPNIIVQDTSLESVLAMVPTGRFLAITTEASLGLAWPDLALREIHDPSGTARLEFALYWRPEHVSPALHRFFGLISERYPS